MTRTRIRDLPTAFWWLWFAELIVWIGRFVVPFMSIFLTTQEGMSVGAAGLVVSAYGVGMMVSSLTGGILADAFGRRRIAAWSLLASVAILIMIPFSPATAATVVLLVAYGLANGACQPVFITLIGDIVPIEHRRMAFNYNYWAVNLGYAIGPIIAGLLADHRFELLFFGQAGLMLVALGVVLSRVPSGIPAPERARTKQRTDAARCPSDETAVPDTAYLEGAALAERPVVTHVDTTGGASSGVYSSAAASATASRAPRPALVEVLRDRPFMVFTLLMFVYAMVYVQSTTTLPMVMTQQGFTSAQYGYLLTVNGLLLCLLQIPAARILGRWSAEIAVAVSLLVTAVGVGVQAAAATLLVYVLAVSVWTLGELGSHAQAQALASDMARPGRRGRYQGVYALHFSLATVFGPLLGGAVLQYGGPAVLWIVAGATSALVAVGLMLTAPARTRHLTRLKQSVAQTNAPSTPADRNKPSNLTDPAGPTDAEGIVNPVGVPTGSSARETPVDATARPIQTSSC